MFVTFLSLTMPEAKKEGSSRIYKLKGRRGKNLLKPEGANNSFWRQFSFQTKSPRRGHQPKQPKGCIMRKHAALEEKKKQKKKNQMVVKHRTGKPTSGISVLSGSTRAYTLLFAFSFLFLLPASPFAVVVWVSGVRQGLTFVAYAGLELKAILKPQLLGHNLVTMPALKNISPTPRRRRAGLRVLP